MANHISNILIIFQKKQERSNSRLPASLPLRFRLVSPAVAVSLPDQAAEDMQAGQRPGRWVCLPVSAGLSRWVSLAS
jgi:hypothetical protein